MMFITTTSITIVVANINQEEGIMDRYTVLLHAFDTFEGACEYITQIVNVGECKVLPLIKAWSGGVVTAKWMAKKTEKGIKFELLDSDMTMFNRRK